MAAEKTAICSFTSRNYETEFWQEHHLSGTADQQSASGKWAGARHETDRFICNTVIRAMGFVDVASKWKMPKSDADFGQTFGQWSWKPRCYLMLPIFGPSNERDTLGFAADTAAKPLTYLSPHPFIPNEPLTYVSPYAYYSGGVVYNNLTDTVDESVRFTQAQMDPYSVLQYAWTLARENWVVELQVKGKQDEASLETLITLRDLPLRTIKPEASI